MRNLPRFGQTGNAANFRYPTDADLRAMPKSIPIEAIKLNWKPSSADISVLGAIQVIYSNGFASPVFLAKDQNADGLQTVVLNSQIKKIRGTANGNRMANIHFLNKNGNETTRIQTRERPFAPDQILADDEEIIGIYGDKDYAGTHPYIASIGFIVWKRP
jgi:hypothetical protein